jgi:cell division protein ZapA
MTEKNGARSAAKNGDAGGVTVEIYDQVYHLRGVDATHVKKLAALVDQKMRAVASRSSTADSLRVAVLAALNLADELSVAKENTEVGIQERTADLLELLDEVLSERHGRKAG